MTEKHRSKVTLIYPPDESCIRATEEELLSVNPPIGIAYIAAFLRQHGVEVEIIDANPLRLTVEDVVARVKRDPPVLVGMTVFTALYSTCVQLARRIKEECPETKIALGGPHVDSQHLAILETEPSVDYCACGEGEHTAWELVQALREERTLASVEGISYREGERTYANPPRKWTKNLDEFPFPARDLLPSMDLYRAPQSLNERKPFTLVLPSRGCPFQCTYCACHAVWGYQRRRSPENVLEEIESVYQAYGLKAMRLEDDLFTANKKWATAICQGLIERGLNTIAWETNGRVGTLTPSLLDTMRRANCKCLAIGIEFGNQKVLDFANKRIKLDQVRLAVKMIRDSGIRVKGYFMIGYPTETRETIEDTIHFSQELGLDYAIFSLVTPFPGTGLYQYVKDHGMLKSQNWDDYHFGSVKTIRLDGISEEELIALQRRAEREFWYRPSQVVKILARHPNFAWQFGLRKGRGMLRNLTGNGKRGTNGR